MKRVNEFLGNIIEKVFCEYFPTTLTIIIFTIITFLVFLYAVVRLEEL